MCVCTHRPEVKARCLLNSSSLYALRQSSLSLNLRCSWLCGRYFQLRLLLILKIC